MLREYLCEHRSSDVISIHRAPLDLVNCPSSMLGDKRIWCACSRDQNRQSFDGPDVAKRDTDVAFEARQLQSFDGRAGEQHSEAGLIQIQQRGECGRAQVSAPVVRHEAARLGKTVPGTRREAIIAAEDPITD